MRLKKQLRITAIVSTLLAVGIAIILVLSLYRLNMANKSAIIVSDIVTSSLERVSFRNDYIQNNNERAKEQWISKNEQVVRLLKSLLEYAEKSEDRKMIGAMLEANASRAEIFSAIVANREKNQASGNLVGIFLEVEKRLVSQMNIRLYEFVVRARALQEASNRIRASALRQAGSGIAVLILIIAAAMMYFWEVGRIIKDRVSRLRDGAEIIGGGNLDHRIGITGNDEFVELASAFNEMTGKLSRSLNELEVEIKEREQAERALQDLNDQLEMKVEQRTLELQESQQRLLHAEKLSAMGKLSASIAHEFNSPLQTLLTVLKSLQKTAVLQEDDKKILVLAIGECDRMKNLIRGLHDFNRPSSGRKALMDVHQSIESILLLVRYDFKRREISIILNFAERLPQILAVQDQIKQVFINLLNNAADACQEHGREITISTWQEEQRVAVAIKDNGIGIEPEKMEQIFEPFYSTKPGVKGTGLGLSISHGIIQNHRGELSITSKPGEGSTFTVLLPVNAG